MREHQDLIHLLLKGEIPPAVCSDAKFMRILPIVNAVNVLYSKGEQPPFKGERVAKLAKTKFNANGEHEQLVLDAEEMEGDAPILEAVKQRMVIEKGIELLTSQLMNGTYNPKAVEELISLQTTTTRELRLLETPKERRVNWIVKTGFGDVDKVVHGFGAELVIVSARPKTGKTTFLLNLVARQPAHIPVLYITVADLGFDEINHDLQFYNPRLGKEQRKNLFVSDLNAFNATILDVESDIKRSGAKLVIVDRAEKLKPLRSNKNDSNRDTLGEIYEQLRKFAKRYECCVITDAQYSGSGADHFRKDQRMSMEFMAEDRTKRQGELDVWFGLQKFEFEKHNEMKLFVEGRRTGTLPAVVTLKTDKMGRYL